MTENHGSAALYFWEGNQFQQDNAAAHNGEDLRLGSDAQAFSMMRNCRLWVFTRDTEGAYLLAASVIVQRTEGPRSPYQHVMVPVPGSTRRFRLFENPTRSVEPVIRALSAFAGKRSKGALGNSFQGHNHFRAISREDDEKLAEFAARLSPASSGKWRFKGMPL